MVNYRDLMETIENTGIVMHDAYIGFRVGRYEKSLKTRIQIRQLEYCVYFKNEFNWQISTHPFI